MISFGEHAEADARLDQCALQPDCSTVEADHPRAGGDLQARGARPPSSCTTRLPCWRPLLVGADLALAALALASLQPAERTRRRACSRRFRAEPHC